VAFTKKIISVDMSLASGVFTGGGNTATLTGLRMSCTVKVVGGDTPATLDLAIYGLSLSKMNQMSAIGTQYDRRSKNPIAVSAGDANGMAVVFIGMIQDAYIDAQSMPDVCFRITANVAGDNAVKDAEVTTIDGSVDVATLMNKQSQAMSLQFENSGVLVKLSNPYYSGSSYAQATRIANDAGIQWVVEKNVLAIWPTGEARKGSAPTVSRKTGMVGYPTFRGSSVFVKTLFNPAVQYGQNITIQSDITPANGTWPIIAIYDKLECEMPRGEWFQIIQAVAIGTNP
jgi:hypothetical protein